MILSRRKIGNIFSALVEFDDKNRIFYRMSTSLKDIRFQKLIFLKLPESFSLFTTNFRSSAAETALNGSHRVCYICFKILRCLAACSVHLQAVRLFVKALPVAGQPHEKRPMKRFRKLCLRNLCSQRILQVALSDVVGWRRLTTCCRRRRCCFH